MKYSFIYLEKEYTVNDSLMFDKQNKSFVELCNTSDFEDMGASRIYNFDTVNIIVYQAGRIIVIEKEVEDGE